MRKNSFGRKLYPASTSCNIISKCIFLSSFTTWISMTHSQLARSSIKNSSCGNCFLSVSTKLRALRRCSTEGKSRSPKWPSKHRVLLTCFTCSSRRKVKVDSNFGGPQNKISVWVGVLKTECSCGELMDFLGDMSPSIPFCYKDNTRRNDQTWEL